MTYPQTCEELAAMVREAGSPRPLNRIGWLDEIVDARGAAEFTGLKVTAVRLYHGQAVRKRRAGTVTEYWPKKGVPLSGPWLWPEPDITLARRPGWKLRTLVIARSAMPGRPGATADKYTPEQRQAAVDRVRAGELPAQVARDLGIPKATVGRWSRG